jgi:glutamine---fructose-6-phosphate transaminase (isomerizing)
MYIHFLQMHSIFPYIFFNFNTMNVDDKKYLKFGLCSDMIRTAELIRNYNTSEIDPYVNLLHNRKKIFVAGEGSSRIFPAKNAAYKSLKYNSGIDFITEGAIQASEYNLKNFAVFGVSNSGKTNELINLFNKLKTRQHTELFGITAHTNTPLESIAKSTHILKCGEEKSVAATISVVEQALFFDTLISKISKIKTPSLFEFSEKFAETLSIKIPEEITQKIAGANIVYFAGRNNGVAEELTLKTNEIIRKRSDYLEGTYAVHGIEEVMSRQDVMILIDPAQDQEPKFKKYLTEGVGVEIYAISTRQTIFPTIIIPEIEYFQNYLEMAAGWNLLVECGLLLNIDMDKPVHARKIGNEYMLNLNTH